MAKASLNAALMSSKEKVENVPGSLASVVHLMVTFPPVVGLVGVRIVSAETKGTTKERRPSLQSILKVCVIKKGVK
jgi:hypothetical protein